MRTLEKQTCWPARTRAVLGAVLQESLPKIFVGQLHRRRREESLMAYTDSKTGMKTQIVHSCDKAFPKTAPVCGKPKCALIHRGLTTVQFLCECGAWHPIADHPETKNHR